MKKRLMAGLLALAMVLMGIPVTAFAADEAETPDAITITENGVYHLGEAETGVITVAEGVTSLTIEGSGEPNAITIDCTAAPGIHLTLRNAALSADSGSILQFSGAGNVLRTEGICLLDSGDTEAVLIRMAADADLTFEGDGALYLYAERVTDGERFTVSGGIISMEGGTVGGTWQLGDGFLRADWAEDAILANTDGEPLYLCRMELSDAAAETYEIKMDDAAVYSGPGFTYRHSGSGWQEESDPNVYLYLTGADHSVLVNGVAYPVYWDSLFGVFHPVKHTVASFSVTPSDAKVVVSTGIGYTYAEEILESKTTDGRIKFSLAPGNYTATITKTGYYASQFSFQVTPEQKITSIDTSSNVKNYLDENGVFTISLPAFQKSSNSGAWDGVTLDVSWYRENASELEISTPAQLAGMAAICNGIYNAEITTILDDTNGDGRTETYTPGEYAALSGRKIRPVCSESDAGDSNQVTTASYWYGVKSNGSTPSDFNGQTVYITADLDMGGCLSGGSWIGARYMTIGGQSLMHYIDYAAKESDGYSHIGSSFNGHLEGQGHIIRNICCNRDTSGSNYGDSSAIGLIGRLGNHDSDPDELMAVDPSVRDLAVTGYIFGRRSVGGIVGKIGRTSASDLKDGSTGGIIENCLNFCEVRNTDAKGVGGIVGAGWNSGLIRNCANFGYIYAGYKNSGGISGSCEVNVINCYNAGYVDAVSIDYAQALATDNGGAVFTNCYWLTGSCYADSDDSYSYPAVYKNDSKDTITEVTSFAEMAGETFLANLNGGGRDWTTASGSDGISSLLASTAFENCKLRTSGVTAEGFPVPRAFVSDTAVTTKIEKLSDPEKLTYVAGEHFDTTGLQIQATYSDGTTELLTDYTVTPSGALTRSDTSVTVSGECSGISYSYEFTITVTDRAVSEIRILTVPVNTIYASDEQIDLSGLEVAAYYTDFPREAVVLSEDEYEAVLNDAELTVSYTYNGKTVTTGMTFTVLSSPAPEQNLEGYYELNCADDLTWFANQVSNVKNTSMSGKVTANITADSIFMGIGKSGAYYAGTFDGGNNTITLNLSTAGTAGLFTGVSGAVIRNVTVAGKVSSTSASSGIAGLAAYVGTGGVTIENCANEAVITGGGSVGGIIGKTASGAAVVSGCENRGAISSSVNYAGGICGYVTKDVSITDCVNSGSVSGVSSVGGIVGYANGIGEDTFIRIGNCGNNGAVSGATNVGGILGYSENEYDEIRACYNAASVTASAITGNGGIGGIAGFFAGQMDSCYNCGTVSCTGNAVSNSSQNAGVGGLMGLAYACDIENSYHSGSVSGDGSSYVKLGGIAGYVYYGTSSAANTYFLEADPLSAYGGTVNSDASLSGDYASVTSAALMTLANTLGSNFKSNGDESYHGGYPVLAWEDMNHIHAWDEGTVAKAATCTESGEKTYTCVCGETKTEIIEATGHRWDAGAVTREPTETEAGEMTYTCGNCGETRAEAIDPVGHTWDEGTVTTEPACIESGKMTYHCMDEGCETTKTEVIEALGHTWKTGVVTKTATCTEAGAVYVTCTGCGKTKTQVIPALGHNYETVTVKVSCTEGGGTTHTCTVCGDSYSEGAEQAPGHTWDEGTITVEATCTDTGERSYTCTVCGEIRTEEIAKTGHRFENGVCTSCGENEALQPEYDEAEDSGPNTAVIIFIGMICIIALVLNRLKFFK